MPVTSDAALLDYLTTPYSREPDSNNAAFLGAFYDAYWAEQAENQAQLRAASHVPTQTGAILDKWATMLSILRGPGETDSSFRLRIAGAIRRLYGGVRVSDIIQFAASVTGAQPSDFQLIENSPPGSTGPAGPGAYVPASYQLKFDVNILRVLGIPPTQFNAIIESLDQVLTDVSAAGVDGSVFVFAGGAQWDVDSYDDGLYGQ